MNPLSLRRLVPLFSILAALVAAPKPSADAGWPRIDDAFERYVAEKQLPGAVVLVKRDGEVAHLGAYGWQDMEARKPMETDTLFRIASQTKAIVSVGIMMLQEDGKLNIDDPVAKLLPEFAETTVAEPNPDGGYTVVPANRQITLRDLLTHTAGIGYGGGLAAEEWRAAGIDGWYFAHREEPVRETVRRMAALPMEAHPGEGFVYGYSTDILGAVIEEASGQSLDAFLRKRIFKPLGMSDTHFYLPKSTRDRLATVYSKRKDEPLDRAPEESAMVGQGAYVDGPRKSFSGGAGLVSTARDYSRFLEMLLNEGELEGERLLSPESVAEMTKDQLPDGVSFPWQSGTGFGLGFEVVEDVEARGDASSLGEYGWGGAYHTDYWIAPQEELVVVFMTQVIPAEGLDVQGELRDLVYEAVGE